MAFSFLFPFSFFQTSCGGFPLLGIFGESRKICLHNLTFLLVREGRRADTRSSASYKMMNSKPDRGRCFPLLPSQGIRRRNVRPHNIDVVERLACMK